MTTLTIFLLIFGGFIVGSIFGYLVGHKEGFGECLGYWMDDDWCDDDWCVEADVYEVEND